MSKQPAPELEPVPETEPTADSTTKDGSGFELSEQEREAAKAKEKTAASYSTANSDTPCCDGFDGTVSSTEDMPLRQGPS